MADGLYDWPDLYDLVLPANPEMEGFYVEATGGVGQQVLDLACGTGRFTLPLARSGAAVTGGDLSENMLAVARRRAAAEALAISFVALDMRDFDLGRRFDAVTIAYDPIAQVSHIDWYWSQPGKGEFRHTKLEMRQIYPQELLLLLERGGFAAVERFGGFDRGPLMPTSMRQVLICALA